MNAQEFSAFLASRRTTRDFLSTPVPPEVINQLLTDALTAPSWSNTRPFKVAVASDDARDRISAEFSRRWAAVSKARNGNIFDKAKLILTRYGLPTSNRRMTKKYVAELLPRAQRVGRELYGALGVARGDGVARDAMWAKNYEFFGAPTSLFIYVHKSLGIYAATDAGLMMENLMLSAHAMGLGTCAQGAVGIWDDVVRSEFEISKDYRLLCGLAIGYPSTEAVNKFGAHRIGPDEIVAKKKS